MRPSGAGLPISVVVPAYDAESFVAEAVQSALRQTRPPAEVIVVNDGSSDRTHEVAARAGARVLDQPNGGCSNARNAGIQAASSPWIAFLDADDVWLPQKLERQWAAHCIAPDAQLIACHYAFRRAASRARPELATHAAYRAAPRHRIAPNIARVDRARIAPALVGGQFLSPSTLVVARSLLQRFPFAEDLPSTRLYHVSEDFEWCLRACTLTDALVVEESLVDHRFQPTGLSACAGRVRFGDLKLGEIVAAAPERYADGAAEAFARGRSNAYRASVYAFLRALDFESAREVISEWRAQERSAATRALFFLTVVLDSFAGRTAAHVARAVWRSAVRPVYRALFPSPA